MIFFGILGILVCLFAYLIVLVLKLFGVDTGFWFKITNVVALVSFICFVLPILGAITLLSALSYIAK